MRETFLIMTKLLSFGIDYFLIVTLDYIFRNKTYTFDQAQTKSEMSHFLFYRTAGLNFDAF